MGVLQGGINQIRSTAYGWACHRGEALRPEPSFLRSSLSQQAVWAEKPFYSPVASWPSSSPPILPPKGNTAVTRQQGRGLSDVPSYCESHVYNIEHIKMCKVPLNTYPGIFALKYDETLSGGGFISELQGMVYKRKMPEINPMFWHSPLLCLLPPLNSLKFTHVGHDF